MDSTDLVPVLDLGKLRGASPERLAAVKDIGRICQKKGFFQVINHGISTDILDGALDAAAAFFDLPMDDKSDLMSDDVAQPVRYSSVAEVDDGEVKIRRHVLKQYSYPLDEWIDKWPAKPWQYIEKMARYATEVRSLVSELMEAISESLGLDRDFLRSQMDRRGFEMMAINCYPEPHTSSGSGGDGVIGLPAHTDYTFVTVLLANSEGLEQFDRESGAWRVVPHRAGTLAVHVGNYLEVVSNRRYRAALHRVVDERVEVAEELVDERRPAAYRGSRLREFIEFLWAGGKSSDFMESMKINGTEISDRVP